MAISGHSSTRMLERYTHPTTEQKIEALESMRPEFVDTICHKLAFRPLYARNARPQPRIFDDYVGLPAEAQPSRGMCGDSPPSRFAASADSLRLACQPKPTRLLASESEGWWTAQGSNLRPPRCERGALPAELAAHFRGCVPAGAGTAAASGDGLMILPRPRRVRNRRGGAANSLSQRRKAVENSTAHPSCDSSPTISTTKYWGLTGSLYLALHLPLARQGRRKFRETAAFRRVLPTFFVVHLRFCNFWGLVCGTGSTATC